MIFFGLVFLPLRDSPNYLVLSQVVNIVLDGFEIIVNEGGQGADLDPEISGNRKQVLFIETQAMCRVYLFYLGIYLSLLVLQKLLLNLESLQLTRSKSSIEGGWVEFWDHGLKLRPDLHFPEF